MWTKNTIIKNYYVISEALIRTTFMLGTNQLDDVMLVIMDDVILCNNGESTIKFLKVPL